MTVSTIPVLDHLSVIAEEYDALLCDAWGVIHNGVALFPDIERALCEFKRLRGPVIILTNAPRPSEVIPPQLDRLGLSRDAWDGVVTSGDAIRAELAKRLPGPFYRLGPGKDDPLYDGLGAEFTSLEEASTIICTGLFDDARETPEDYRDMLREAANRDLEMICANPDIRVRWGDRVIYCAGALAQLYEQLGGRVAHGGKPHRPIYDLAYKRLQALRPDIDRKKILAIGDGLHTDILGANLHSIDVAYIYGAGGIHDGQTDPASLKSILDEANVTAKVAMERLVW